VNVLTRLTALERRAVALAPDDGPRSPVLDFAAFAAAYTEIVGDHFAHMDPEARGRQIADWTRLYESEASR
jgi:hypothetical protein